VASEINFRQIKVVALQNNKLIKSAYFLQIMKQALYTQLKEIQDNEIRNFVKEVLDHAPEGFWHTPCSGTGKYHPPENQGDAGLIRHLLKCVVTAKDLCRYFGLNQEDTDIVLAATILHDIKKNGEPWGESTDMEHGLIGAKFLDKFELREPAKTEIKNCVRYHLSRFTRTREDVERASNPTQKELIVQMTDLFCSRKYASWLPDINVKEEDIKNFFKKFQTDLNCF
jgi:putative nucleotidyltransferase with HDIG domain